MNSVIQIKHLYSSKGYINSKINTNVEIDENSVFIDFKIIEGNQYHITNIELFGNRIFSNKEILEILNVNIDDVFNPLYITKQLKVLIRKYLEAGKFYISVIDELLEDDNEVPKI